MTKVNITNGILELLNRGLSAWEKYISTRQEAYERKMDKRKEKALNLAEESFEVHEMLYDYIIKELVMTTKESEYLEDIQKKYLKIKKKFNKLD